MRMIAKCLVTTSLVLVAASAAAPVQAAELNATSAVDAVTVYPDGASVTRIIAVDLPAGDNTLVARDFPLGLDASSLRVEGEAATRIVIGAIDARPPRAAPPVNLPEIDKRIEALKDERVNLDGAIAAANARRKFAERFAEASPAGLGEKGEARPIAEWRTAFAAVSEEVAAADAAIREAERKQRDIDREIARLEADRAAKPPNKLEVRIDLAATAPAHATLKVTYAVRHARWTPLYDARLDTGTKDRKAALELVRRADITQTTGEDWSNIALAVSTVRMARGGSAPELNSLIVQYPPAQPPRPMGLAQEPYRRAMPAPAAAPAPADEVMEKKADEQQASVEVSAFQVTFKIPGRVAIYRDGMFVGSGRMAAASKDETVRLGFGADDKIKIERTVLKRNEGSAGLIVTTSKTDERAFKTSVRNGHDFPIRIAIEDQLPVSENEEILVEMLPSTTPPTSTNLRDKRGVLEWAFEAKPGEVRDIAFAWRVRWPKDKGVVMMPAG